MSTQGAAGSIEEETGEVENQAQTETAGTREVASDPEDETGQAKKRMRREPTVLVREAGKSLLPFSRVQKIIKADKEIPIIAKDATFLISLATEEFIKRLCEEGKGIAEREKRSTIQHKDIATAVRKADEFLFLEEIIPWVLADAPVRRKSQAVVGMKGDSATLERFVTKSKEAEDDEVAERADIITNTDGTMAFAENLEESMS